MDPFSAKRYLPALLRLPVRDGVAGVGAALVFFTWQLGKRWLPLPRLRWGRWTGRRRAADRRHAAPGPIAGHAILDSLALLYLVLRRGAVADAAILVGRPAGPAAVSVLAFAGLRGLSGTYPVDLGLSRQPLARQCAARLCRLRGRHAGGARAFRCWPCCPTPSRIIRGADQGKPAEGRGPRGRTREAVRPRRTNPRPRNSRAACVPLNGSCCSFRPWWRPR